MSIGRPKKFDEERALEAAYVTMANAPSLLQSYLSSYDIFRQESLFSPVEQEVLFLTISRYHGCEYCVSAHSVIADAMSVPAEITNAIRDDQPVPDEKLAALISFTRIMLGTRGLPTIDDVNTFWALDFLNNISSKSSSRSQSRQ